VADIAEGDLTPAWLSSENMLLKFKRQLSADGVLVMNLLVADAQSMSNILMTMRQVFERRTLCLSVPDHKNIIAMAFKQPPYYGEINELQSRINELTEIWELDFKSLLQQLRRDNPQGSGIF
jgi:spermidine synthase